jgi:cytochrome c oxidase cbb3-type subunit 2
VARLHFLRPRDVVPESNMPAYPWLATAPADAASIEAKMRALQMVGVPYTGTQITAARDDLKDKTEMDALIAYLQGMGTALKGMR